jgi:ABC-type multidrug transport system fused ATPase/permease subunit
MEHRDRIEKELEDGIWRFEKRLDYLKSRSRKLSYYRLVIFLASLVFFFYFFFAGNTLPLYITIAVFIILFGILTGIHNNLERGIKKNLLWTGIKKLHIARMNLEWDKLPPSVFTPDNKHPYDFDLSITGEYSLHRLQNTASSFEGSRRLKDWLTSDNISREEILKRQELVKELIDKKRFRDKLSLFSMLVSRKELKGTKLLEWINSSSELTHIRKIFIILALIIPVNVILFVLFLLNMIPAYFLFSALLYVAIYWLNGKYTSGIFEDLLVIEDEFGKFTVIFEFLEKYPYKKNSRLRELASVYLDHSPSNDFKMIKRIASAISVTRNPLAALVLNVIFPYNFYFALKLEKIRIAAAEELPVWLDRWYTLEAYNSLANYAYLNPQTSFPDISSENNSSIKAVQIAHPLIHYRNNTANDFELNNRGEVYVITGSNMSGKSTFLKTMGINLAMAYSGGTVYAANFTVSLFRLYCCINISDSVIDGISYFYAEVKRLKKMLEQLKNENANPLFFLVDEIFRGTNNIERLKGSRAYIKQTVKLNGAGLVSTHDLELSKLEEEIPSVKNFHFREEAIEGRMIFDYKIHPGPSPTTNALKIMKTEGLPIE